VQLPSSGNIIAFPEVGGLHHRYERRLNLHFSRFAPPVQLPSRNFEILSKDNPQRRPAGRTSSRLDRC
jgi:hypothetical protein